MSPPNPDQDGCYPTGPPRSGTVGGDQYRGIVHTIRTMAREEGVRSLYRGFAPKIIGIFPYAGLNFGTFESLKEYAPSPDHLKPGSAFLMICGALAGTTGQTVGYPFDLVTRRFQMLRPDGGRVYSSVWVHTPERVRPNACIAFPAAS